MDAQVQRVIVASESELQSLKSLIERLRLQLEEASVNEEKAVALARSSFQLEINSLKGNISSLRTKLDNSQTTAEEKIQN